MEGDTVLKMISTKNVVSGQDLSVRFDVVPNEIINRKDDEILSYQISGKLPQMGIEDKLKELLSQVEKEALKKGVLADVSGKIQGLPYDDIYGTARRIKGYGTEAKVKVLANSDIYTIGPLSLRLEVEI